jgi:hypothetical protein
MVDRERDRARDRERERERDREREHRMHAWGDLEDDMQRREDGPGTRRRPPARRMGGPRMPSDSNILADSFYARVRASLGEVGRLRARGHRHDMLGDYMVSISASLTLA